MSVADRIDDQSVPHPPPRNRFRISIGELMGLIALAAVVFADANYWVDLGVFETGVFLWLYPCFKRTVRESRTRRKNGSPLTLWNFFKLAYRWATVGFLTITAILIVIMMIELVIVTFLEILMCFITIIISAWMLHYVEIVNICLTLLIYWYIMLFRLKFNLLHKTN